MAMIETQYGAINSRYIVMVGNVQLVEDSDRFGFEITLANSTRPLNLLFDSQPAAEEIRLRFVNERMPG